MPHVTPLFLARDGEILLSSDMLDCVFDDYIVDEKLGQRYARKLTAMADALGVKMKLSLQTKRVVEQMVLPKTTEWDQYYLRFLADYTLYVSADGKEETVSGEMLHEYAIMYPDERL
jgi:hypothetical protein